MGGLAASLFLWLVVGPVGLFVGAPSRQAAAQKMGEEAGQLLAIAGAILLTIFLGGFAVWTKAGRTVDGDDVFWVVLAITFYIPFAAACLTRNRWLMLASLPVAGLASIFVGGLYWSLVSPQAAAT